MILGRPIKLSIGTTPPTEFRLFSKGWNDTENGRFLFDDVAAKSVMAAYRAWGIDLAVDLEHQSLEVEAGESPDPTARDARGWFKLELRPDGSLWAVSATWTPDGVRRLTEKTQRYISPAFECDPKTKRVMKVINAALTSIPATHRTPALVAASKRGMAMNVFDPATMSPDDAQKKIAQVAEILGVADPTSFEAIDSALDACFAAVSAAEDGAGSDDELTESERKACSAYGASPADFLAVKNGMNLKNIQTRLARADAAAGRVRR